jgi:cysteinyl-tRNA synthetase
VSKKSYQRLVQLFDKAQDTYDYPDMKKFPIVQQMDMALQDDLNTPALFAVIFTNFNAIACDLDLKDAVFSYCVRVLGLSFVSEQKSDDQDTDRIDALVKQRDQARKDQNWAEADRIRDELLAKHNYVVVDRKIE